MPQVPDIHWIRADYPVGHPEFGKMYPCECIQTQLLSGASGLRESELKLTWSSIRDDGDAFKALRAIKDVFKQGYGWVYLWGGPGIAKSVLLKVAVAEMLRGGLQGTYTNMSQILDHLREAYDTDYPNSESVRRLNRWSQIRLLAIDEFDRVKETGYAAEKRFRLMDERYQAAYRKQTITLMASNEPPEVYDSYLTDRIGDGRFVVVEMRGESLRPGLDWTFDL